MSEKMEVNEHILKLIGTVSLFGSLEIGDNYHVIIEGSIVGKSEDNNEDGTVNLTYKFRPIKVEVLTPKGQMIKTKDNRKMSQKLRGRIWMLWQESHEQIDFLEYYEKRMKEIISNLT